MKVFVLSRVTVKQLKTLPGVDPADCTGDPSLVGSNIFSVAEIVLLKWMTMHMKRALPKVAQCSLNGP
jgi:hypothetical protein